MSKLNMETKKVTFCRSNFDLGDFNDDNPGGGERLVDDSHWEDTKTLVNRMTRGESEPRFKPQYQFDSRISVEEAEKLMNPIRKQGFDLSDVAEIEARANQEKKYLDEKFKKARKLAQDTLKNAQDGVLEGEKGKVTPQ